MRTFCAALLALVASGCVSSYAGTARDADAAVLAEPGWTSVRVAAVRQESKKDCGAAALAMVLGYFGSSVAPVEIESMRADALRDFARSRGFAAHCIPGERADLAAELADGRPVLVGLVKPTLEGGVQHYEVVVGMSRDEIATIDPARGLTVNSWEGFDREWTPAKRLAVIIAPPPSR
ncbi:MAG TPA: cysteine peptidase family C39 domain-containing protein [Planctomycetota bacterium]|nr:cysteine peptidase family C39 domain-containing protein [Planctomycetota bacterium]